MRRKPIRTKRKLRKKKVSLIGKVRSITKRVLGTVTPKTQLVCEVCGVEQPSSAYEENSKVCDLCVWAKEMKLKRDLRVACIADYDAARTEESLLLGEIKILTDRVEVLQRNSLKVPNLPPLGFRVYRRGRHAVTVHTLSQMAASR